MKQKVNFSHNSIFKKDIKKLKKVNIIFSPSAASFDQFLNFEERGKFFNYLIKNKLLK